MAVIQPWFDPTRRRAQSAFVTYWDGFITERSSMNKMLLQQHFASMSDEGRSRIENTLDGNIIRLQEARAGLLQEGIASKGDILGRSIAGQYNVMASQAHGQAIIGAAQIGAIVNLTELNAETSAAWAARTTLSSSQHVQIAEIQGPPPTQAQIDAAATANLPAPPAGTSASSAVGTMNNLLAGIDDPATKQYIMLAVLAQAESMGNTEAANAIRGADAFIAPGAFQGVGAGEEMDHFMSVNGLTPSSDLEVALGRVRSIGIPGLPAGPGGGGGGGVPQRGDTWRGRDGRIYTNVGGGNIAELEQDNQGEPVIRTENGENTPVAIGWMRADELPGDWQGWAEDDDLGLRGIQFSVDAAVASIDRQLEGQQAQLTRVQSQRGGEGDLFGPFANMPNYMLGNLFARPHQRQGILDLAAETARSGGKQTVREAVTAIEQTRGPLGRIRPERQAQKLWEEDGQVGGPGIFHEQIIDRGQRVGDWARAEWENISASVDEFGYRPRQVRVFARQMENLADQAEAAGISRERVYPLGLQGHLDDLIATSTYTDEEMALLDQQGRWWVTPVHIAEIIEGSIDNILAIEDPEEKVAAARALGEWADDLPDELAGGYGTAVGGAVEGNILRGTGPALLVDLQNLANTAGQHAKEGISGIAPSERQREDEAAEDRPVMPREVQPDEAAPTPSVEYVVAHPVSRIETTYQDKDAAEAAVEKINEPIPAGDGLASVSTVWRLGDQRFPTETAAAREMVRQQQEAPIPGIRAVAPALPPVTDLEEELREQEALREEQASSWEPGASQVREVAGWTLGPWDQAPLEEHPDWLALLDQQANLDERVRRAASTTERQRLQRQQEALDRAFETIKGMAKPPTTPTPPELVEYIPPPGDETLSLIDEIDSRLRHLGDLMYLPDAELTRRGGDYVELAAEYEALERKRAQHVTALQARVQYEDVQYEDVQDFGDDTENGRL